MLRDTAQVCQPMAPPNLHEDYQVRFKRNEKKDLKRAMDLFFRFKENLEKLHPNCTQVIYNMLQTRGI